MPLVFILWNIFDEKYLVPLLHSLHPCELTYWSLILYICFFRCLKLQIRSSWKQASWVISYCSMQMSAEVFDIQLTSPEQLASPLGCLYMCDNESDSQSQRALQILLLSRSLKLNVPKSEISAVRSNFCKASQHHSVLHWALDQIFLFN